jgi:hypothetical protein
VALLDSIDLSYTIVLGRAYPKIDIYGLRELTGYDAATDRIELERYVIDINDSAAMSAVSKVISDQVATYYMSDATYMSTYMWMGDSEHDLGSDPEYFDISAQLLAGRSRIIDLATDISKYMYVYRIIIVCGGKECSSNYVAGLVGVSIVGDGTEILPDELTDESGIPEGTTGSVSQGGDIPSGGSVTFGSALAFEKTVSFGSASVSRTEQLYRTSLDGKIITKGMPIMTLSPRYQGPFEGAKETAQRRHLCRAAQTLETMSDAVESVLNNAFALCQDIGETLVSTLSEQL